jgi:hypothetical protein
MHPRKNKFIEHTVPDIRIAYEFKDVVDSESRSGYKGKEKEEHEEKTCSFTGTVKLIFK